MSFGDVVKGQEKHDVARSFSALLQLVIALVSALKRVSFMKIIGQEMSM